MMAAASNRGRQEEGETVDNGDGEYDKCPYVDPYNQYHGQHAIGSDWDSGCDGCDGCDGGNGGSDVIVHKCSGARRLKDVLMAQDGP